MGGPLRRIELPPVWLALFMGIGWALDRFAPILRLEAALLGWGLIAAALALAIWAALAFRRRRTSIIPRREADALVTSGPYRFSRNPIYLADLMILAGFGCVIGSPWPILLTPLLGLILERRFIRPEEAMLARVFPEAFAAWRRRTRRWL